MVKDNEDAGSEAGSHRSGSMTSGAMSDTSSQKSDAKMLARR